MECRHSSTPPIKFRAKVGYSRGRYCCAFVSQVYVANLLNIKENSSSSVTREAGTDGPLHRGLRKQRVLDVSGTSRAYQESATAKYRQELHRAQQIARLRESGSFVVCSSRHLNDPHIVPERSAHRFLYLQRHPRVLQPDTDKNVQKIQKKEGNR